LISDTHGLLRPEALQALSGVQRIIHAGDIGDPGILEELRAIAPLAAIRGNNDRGQWATRLPATLTLTIGGLVIHVLHDIKGLDLDPAAEGVDVVVSGHSHQPAITRREGVLLVNPGSAGPRRFSLPVCIGYLRIRSGLVRGRLRHIL
jgi:putative phosphoesterase